MNHKSRYEKLDTKTIKLLQNEYKRGYTAGRMSRPRANSMTVALTVNGGDVTEFVRRISKMPDSRDTGWVNIRDCARLLLATHLTKPAKGGSNE